MAPNKQVPKSNGPVDWTARIAELEREAAETGETLVKTREQRRTLAGSAIAFNTNTDSKELAALVDQERELERRVDNLTAAIEVAREELRKQQEAEKRRQIEALQVKRDEVGAKIREHASTVDRLFTESAEHLEVLDSLLREFQGLGRGRSLRLPVSVTRAALHQGLRRFILHEFVGDPHHCHPLLEQVEGIVGPRLSLQSLNNPVIVETPEAMSA